MSAELDIAIDAYLDHRNLLEIYDSTDTTSYQSYNLALDTERRLAGVILDMVIYDYGVRAGIKELVK